MKKIEKDDKECHKEEGIKWRERKRQGIKINTGKKRRKK